MKRILKRRPTLGIATLWKFDLAIALFAAAVPAVLFLLDPLSCPAWVVEWSVMLLVLASGVLGGSIFPLSANIVLGEKRETGRAAGSVDAADHVGACIGALITGVILLPAIGIRNTCFVLCLLKLLSTAFLALSSRLRKRAPK